RGVIKDPSGALVPGATISLLSPATGFSVSVTSNAAGEYQFPQIPPAKYTITVTAGGFGSQTKSAELLVNQPATIDFSLSVQASNVVVNVSAEAQVLNTSDASLGNSMNSALIQELPSETRNVPDLLSLQPGVLYLPAKPDGTVDSRTGAVNGGRSDQGNITVDGVDDNDEVNGTAFLGVLRETQDSIEEFRVSTTNTNADSGRSSGAQVSLVTKSGTNKFHGAAYEYYRPTFTVANDWFNKQAQLNSDEPNIPGKLIRNIFGVAVGGPIKTDKLFFFGNYEGSRQAENAQVTQTTPTAAYQQGLLTYQNTDDNNVTLTSAQVATLDAACAVCGTAAYPNPPGPDSNALGYFNKLPTANGSLEGDGVNEGSYSFSSPHPIRLNTSIGRIDYTPSDKHRIFFRGNLQKDYTGGTEQFPGEGPSTILEDNTKGFTAGHTWTISPQLVNDIRYGYIRQGFSNRGLQTQDYTDFRFLTTLTAETPTAITSVPVNNIVDNFNWNKGKHNFEIGGNWRLVHQNFQTNSSSFNSGSSNPYWLGGTAPSPDDLNQGFGNSYLIAYANLVGVIPYVTDNYNYRITSPTSASLLGDGAPLSKRFSANEYEYYLQDSWRVKPNLTVTFGMRHTILQTPHETTGQQISPTIDTHSWYLEREAAALKGQIDQPDLAFSPSGPYYGKQGYWPKSKNNIAPRLAIAYSPDPKTSIRAGAGIYYDHFGEALVNNFAKNGSFGLSSQVSNPASIYSTETAPRFTSRNTIPFNNGVAPSTETFPYTPADYNALITTGLDSKIKTPYSESFDLSVQRELPSGFTLEVSYVGRLGRHLLQNVDLAEPTDYVDPAGGGDYYAAGTQLYKQVDANGGYSTASSTVPGCNCYQYAQVSPIPYFEHLFPWMANFDYPGESATQAIYTDEWSPSRENLGATTALIDLDLYCGSAYIGESYPCPSNFQSRFWQYQFASLFSLTSNGMSYYNAGQVTLRHPLTHGLQMDVSYTLAKSIDMGSDTEKNNFGAGTLFSIIWNTWKPEYNRAVSDFDTRHLITIDYFYQLPFGNGKEFLGGANHVEDAFIGGWGLSGILRGSSGLPFGLFEPGYTTNWTYGSAAVVTQKVKMRRHFDNNGDPEFFDDPDAINNGVATGSPVRLPYPGEAGERNFFRGDGYFNLDSGLSKKWGLGEYGSLKFAWEVYNVTNTVRFDPASIGSGLTGGNLGVASSLLTTPRRMQFSLRYDF
ncbi:MAG TPA: carboxypeptidase regulatory-like domain-containing protein, partial [Terriglobales bacterium]